MDFLYFDINPPQSLETASAKVAKMKPSVLYPFLFIVCLQNNLDINNCYEHNLAKIYLIDSLTQN